MSAVVIDGGLVHYEAFGRGKPVLFLHGWLGSWRYWMSTMEGVSDKHRTYALDLWGFGDSDKSRPRYTVGDYVSLVNDFVNNMGIRDAPIIGHALGATVALEYAVSPHSSGIKKVMAVSLPMNSDCINRKLIDFANNSVIAKMMWWRQITYKEVQKEAEKTGEGAIIMSIQSVEKLNILDNIQILSQQADSMLLAVYGEKDDVIDPTPTREFNGSWKNVRQIGLADSKHFPMLDEAAKFTRLLKDFLTLENDLSALELKDEWRRRTR